MRIMTPIDVTTLEVAGTTAPTTGQGTAFPSGLTNGCGTLYFLNKSNFGLLLQFEDGNVVSLPAWFARPFKVPHVSNQLWITQAYMLNIASPPIQQLWYEAYQQNEPADGLYSGPIPYQSTVGGSVSSTLTQIINSGEGVPNDVILDTPAGYTSPSIDLINTGELHVTPKGNGGQTDALAVIPGGGVGVFARVQMDAGKLTTDGLGGLTSTKALNGATQAYFNARPSDSSSSMDQGMTSGGDWVFVDQGGIRFQIRNAANGSGIKSGTIGQYLIAWSRFTGTGSGTYSHGLGTTPNAVFVTDSTAASSMTVGVANANSTTVDVTCGAAHAFNAVALRVLS